MTWDHVATVTLYHIVTTMILDTIVVFVTIVEFLAFVIPTISQLTSSPVMWCKEKPSWATLNFSRKLGTFGAWCRLLAVSSLLMAPWLWPPCPDLNPQWRCLLPLFRGRTALRPAVLWTYQPRRSVFLRCSFLGIKVNLFLCLNSWLWKRVKGHVCKAARILDVYQLGMGGQLFSPSALSPGERWLDRQIVLMKRTNGPCPWPESNPVQRVASYFVGWLAYVIWGAVLRNEAIFYNPDYETNYDICINVKTFCYWEYFSVVLASYFPLRLLSCSLGVFHMMGFPCASFCYVGWVVVLNWFGKGRN
jgi:hypothetical protein